MDSQTLLSEARLLPPEERIALVERIWETIAEQGVAIPPTEAQKRELDRRIAARESGPPSLSWEDVKASILAKYE